MLVKFEDDDLRRLYEERDFRVVQIGPELTKKFRRLVGILVHAVDEQDLRALRSLHYEKLEGDGAGQRSLRLDQQWRLIVRIETTEEGKTVIVIEIADYH
jgi:proteic killer suppression protein